ncbi:MAG TPA: DNA polymerase III subunit alpha, partial [Paracoccaceae bacterium]|nr:DNA polymerase III subunit alpha [Paracoccaceae bacterium]
KRPLENLARAGAFDALEPNRNRVLQSLDALVDYSATSHAEKASAQVSLFGGAGEALPPPRLAQARDWLPTQRLAEELGAVGFYLSGHPLDDFLPALRRKRVQTGAEFMATAGRAGGAGRIAGTLAGRRDRKSARGNRYAFIQFSDPQGLWEVSAFSDVLAENEELLQPGRNLVCHVQAEVTDEQTRLTLRAVQPVEQVAEDAAAIGLEVHVSDAGAYESIRNRLEHLSAGAGRRRGEGPVKLVIVLPELGQEVEIDLPGQYAVSTEIRGALKHAPGVQDVRTF